MSAAGDSGAEAGDFARRFGEFWAAPRPDLLSNLLADRVRLVAPMTPTTSTLEQGMGVFDRLLTLIPDLTGEVHRWAATDDGVLIEFTLAGTLGGSAISWDAVDRFTLDADGLATERVSYFDSAGVVAAGVTRPRAWPALLRAGLRRPGHI